MLRGPCATSWAAQAPADAVADTYAVLRLRDFRYALLARFFGTVGLQLQSVVLGWQIYRLTGDPLALGCIGLAEALPFMGCLLWAGHVSDDSEKRRIVAGAELGLLGCALAFVLLAAARLAVAWPLYAVIGATGVCRSFLAPAGSAYVDLTVPQAMYSQAAGWNSTVWQLAAVVGPVVGGTVFELAGAVPAYSAAVVCFALALGCTLRSRRCPAVAGDAAEPGLARLLGGIRYVFSHRVILPAIRLDMLAVLFGGAVALFPIFAERLGVGPSGLGWLRAAPAFGALLMALYLAHRPLFAATGRAMLLGVALFGGCMIGFALSPWFPLSLALLAISGGADNISVVVRASIIQAMTPNPLRGRVASVNSMFISSSNEIGAFESGVAATLLGTVPSVVLGGGLTLACVVAAAWRSPALRGLRMAHLAPAPPAGDA